MMRYGGGEGLAGPIFDFGQELWGDRSSSVGFGVRVEDSQLINKY